VRSELPELPDTMRARLVATHGLTDQDATQLTSSYGLAAYYDAVCASLSVEDATGFKPVANWVLGEFSAALNRSGIDVASAPVAPETLAGLLRRVADGTLSGKMAKAVFDELWTIDATAGSIVGQPVVDAIIDRRGLRQVSDSTAIEALVDAVIAAQPAIVAEFRAGKEKAFNALAAQPAIVAEFRAGKEKAFNALVGHVMKASKGKANPGEVNAVLRRKLAA
jgi:aspartyl-tRNA(Asn)/glutamyl-tRNA(Gln) amidotransferase subunit B